MIRKKGDEITEKSFSIIRERLGDFRAGPEEMEIIIRIAHTTGDVEFAKTFLMTREALLRGAEALARGRNVVTDVEIVRAGIRRGLVEEMGGRVECLLNDPEVVAGAAKTGGTRSELAMRRAAPLLEGGIAAIGNAPTALFALLDMIREGTARPALVVGVPVGFVGAAESKKALAESGVPCVTNPGERGGSTIAAAVVNGLLVLARRHFPQRPLQEGASP